MTTEEAQKVLDELQSVGPEMLNDEAKRLFETIMKIADARDEALIENRRLKTIVDLMAKYIVQLDTDEDICSKVKQPCKDYAGDNKMTCDECIKQHFENKVKEDKR